MTTAKERRIKASEDLDRQMAEASEGNLVRIHPIYKDSYCDTCDSPIIAGFDRCFAILDLKTGETCEGKEVPPVSFDGVLFHGFGTDWIGRRGIYRAHIRFADTWEYVLVKGQSTTLHLRTSRKDSCD